MRESLICSHDNLIFDSLIGTHDYLVLIISYRRCIVDYILCIIDHDYVLLMIYYRMCTGPPPPHEGTPYAVKVYNAQKAGAVGVIIVEADVRCPLRLPHIRNGLLHPDSPATSPLLKVWGLGFRVRGFWGLGCGVRV